MGSHLYVCEAGGSMVVAMDGVPAPWVTCPACDGIECPRCDGAELHGDADDFSDGVVAVYRCPSGHQKSLRVPGGLGLPESAQCTECDRMLLPVR